jgi:TonB family protein
MRPRCLYSAIQSGFVAACLIVASAVAQNQEPASSTAPLVVLIKLSPPVYPPLARQARIAGEVKLQVAIQSDGSVLSAAVVSGHPMLQQAALESAQKSIYECRACNQPENSNLVYSFEIRSEGDCCTAIDHSASVSQSGDRVQVVAPELCICDPTEKITRMKFHSLKCLYLWRCGSRIVGVE